MIKNILITGASGFIGSNLVKDLITKNYRIDCVDDLSSGRRVNLEKLRLNFNFTGDFVSDMMLKTIEFKKYDTVIHLAANPRVLLSVEKPVETTNNNVLKTVKLIDTCIKAKVKRFIFASSSAVYGETSIYPTSEEMLKQPLSPYAWQKSCIEDYLKLAHGLYGLDSVSLRFFNVFGPSQYGGDAYSTAIGNWCSAIKNNKPLRLDGDGTASRDMCHVDNVVDAINKCIEHKDLLKGDVFNICCGKTTTNNEILMFFKQRFPNLKIMNAPPRPGDVKLTLGSYLKAKSVLGYEPVVHFWEGLEKTFEWWKI